MGKVQSNKTQMTSTHRRGVTASPVWDNIYMFNFTTIYKKMTQIEKTNG
jgi:hypothetical protein